MSESMNDDVDFIQKIGEELIQELTGRLPGVYLPAQKHEMIGHEYNRAEDVSIGSHPALDDTGWVFEKYFKGFPQDKFENS
jgi:hypothetical protein